MKYSPGEVSKAIARGYQTSFIGLGDLVIVSEAVC